MTLGDLLNRPEKRMMMKRRRRLNFHQPASQLIKSTSKPKIETSRVIAYSMRLSAASSLVRGALIVLKAQVVGKE